ncbi:MAG: aldose 1-epimerase [Spirochaetales bacterium]|nr:aldose 1-epimerase [Spirochaetales bacterium]
MISSYIIDSQDIVELALGENKVAIVKSLGGTIYSLILNKTNILFHDKTEELTKNDLFRGRILFPFNDRIPQGKYNFEGNEYQFPLNCDDKDSIHGLIYNQTMTEVDRFSSSEIEEVELEKIIDKGDFLGYPFSIKINIRYRLTLNSFSMNITVKNIGSKRLPYAIGWHPYFTFGNKIDSSKLQFPGDFYYDVDENLYFKGNKYSVVNSKYDFNKKDIIGNRELDIAININGESKVILENELNYIQMEFSKDMFPALQLFIPEDRQSIAIEPISGPSDSFNYPEAGLRFLDSLESETGTIKVLSGRN